MDGSRWRSEALKVRSHSHRLNRPYLHQPYLKIISTDFFTFLAGAHATSSIRLSAVDNDGIPQRIYNTTTSNEAESSGLGLDFWPPLIGNLRLNSLGVAERHLVIELKHLNQPDEKVKEVLEMRSKKVFSSYSWHRTKSLNGVRDPVSLETHSKRPFGARLTIIQRKMDLLATLISILIISLYNNT